MPTQLQRTQFRQGLPLSWSWATKPQPSCLHFTLALQLQASRSHLAFYMNAGDSNSELNARTASSLTIDPFPPSPHLYTYPFICICLGGDLLVERSKDNLEAAGSFLPPVQLPAIELRWARRAASAFTPEPFWSGLLFTFFKTQNLCPQLS